MKVFYVFGTDKIFPYYGGWIEIEAPTMNEAHVLFRKFFPDRIPGVLRCADYYSEKYFARTDMPTTGDSGLAAMLSSDNARTAAWTTRFTIVAHTRTVKSRKRSDKLPASYRQIKSPERGDV